MKYWLKFSLLPIIWLFFAFFSTLTQIHASASTLSVSVALYGIGTKNSPASPKSRTRNATIYAYDPTARKLYHATDTLTYQSSNIFANPSFSVANIPSGTYQLYMAVPKYEIKQIQTGTITLFTLGSITSLPTITLTPGDIAPMNTADVRGIGDNLLNSSDYKQLASCYGFKQHKPQCANNLIGDLNDDGVINGVDYNLFLHSLISSPTGDTPPGLSETGTSPTPTPSQPPGGSVHPVLAFYFVWYSLSSWKGSGGAEMTDLPSIQYASSDDTAINRHITQAANAGISGFLSSWWGPNDQTDKNFVKLLADSQIYESQTQHHFASAINIETGAGSLKGTTNLITGINYIKQNYLANANYFTWQGKPVIFVWQPLANGVTLQDWKNIRTQVDPNNQLFFSAEGTDYNNLLTVFDAIHLFSAGDWGLQNGNMAQVDQGFRSGIDAFNKTHHTNKLWIAGVEPGYNDTKIPNRNPTHVIARNNGATYKTSWNAAIASKPDIITISTFNEWYEGSMIEPSISYGNIYLDLTKQLSSGWK